MILTLIPFSWALADNIVYPHYPFLDGDTLLASQINGFLNAITAQVNGNLKDVNIAAGALINPSKINFAAHPLMPAGGGIGTQTAPTNGQIPIGSTASGFYQPANIIGGSNVTVVNGANSITLNSSNAAATVPNALINGGFDIAQRSPQNNVTANNGFFGGPDRWYALNPGATSRLYQDQTSNFGGTAVAQYCGVAQDNSSNGGCALAQIIESANSTPFQGQEANFQITLAGQDNNTHLRIAIVEWTQSNHADQVNWNEGGVARNMIRDWASGTYTAGNFFSNNHCTVDIVSADLVPGNSWVTYNVQAAVSANCQNLAVLVFSQSTGKKFGATQAICTNVNGNAMPWSPKPIAEELRNCQRYFWASDGWNNNGAGQGVSTHFQTRTAVPAGTVDIPQSFPFPTMWASPDGSVNNLVVTLYSSSGGGTAGSIRDVTTGQDFVTTASNVSNNGFQELHVTAGAHTIALDDELQFSYSVEDEL